MHDRWDDNVCLQTSQASCSPAAAATLLRAYCIDTTEQEMALLCLTSREGTSMLGLYRGLKIKTRNTAWDVYMFDSATIDDLRGAGPVLLSVELRDGRLEQHMQTWGWIPGVPHTVVLLGFVGDDKVLVADPAIGREVWFIDDLRLLWHGEGARLVRAK
jgi:predicted double-glycine peptidase